MDGLLYVFPPFYVVKDIFLVPKISSGESRSLKNRLVELKANNMWERGETVKPQVSLRQVASINNINPPFSVRNDFVPECDLSQTEKVSIRRILLEGEMDPAPTGLAKLLCEQHNADPMNIYELTDFNRQMTDITDDSNKNLGLDVGQEIKGLKVARAFNQGDLDTVKWRPQGIACDLHANRNGRNRKYIIVSWYNYNDNVDGGDYGTRLSFINIDTWEYRHVLLVQPTGNDKVFEAAKGHAGGIAWYGDYIYVAYTDVGFQVYNINHLIRAKDNPDKDKVGVYSDGFYAYDYKYFLPLTGTNQFTVHKGKECDPVIINVHKDDDDFGLPKFSFVSVVRGNSKTPDCLLSGEFDNCPGHTSWLSKWALDSSGLLNPFIEQPFGIKEFNLDIGSVQGAAEALGFFWFSQSTNPDGPSILHQLSRKAQIGHSGQAKYPGWPMGAEDLDFDDSDNSLWCLTEYESDKDHGKRKIFNIDLAAY